MENESKIRVMRLYQILNELSDEEHPISTVELIKMLDEKYGIQAHRITISKDIAVLEQCGVDIVKINTTQNKYFIGSRLFEIPELKLLIDAVESSKFITEKKSKILVSKLATLTSVNRAAEMKRNLCVANRIKPENEMIYYIVDAINDAINQAKKISFQYFEYDASKKKKLKNGGHPYVFSPYALSWNGDYYYVVGYSDKHQKISTFRVDRILNKPEVLQEDSVPEPKTFNVADFAKAAFGMYDGSHRTVELRCDNSLMKTIIDRFGEDVPTKPYSMTDFKVTVEASITPTFYGWIFGFGKKLEILEPQDVKAGYIQQLREAYDSFQKKN